MTADDKVVALGLTLPPLPPPGGNYLAARRIGNMLYLSGVISSDASGVLAGTLGEDCSVEEGYLAARHCALTQLAVLRRELGSLAGVIAVVSVNGYVHCIPGFAESPAVINGFSDLIVEVFGEAGRHVRAAVGVSALPRNARVEVQMSVLVAEP